MPSENQSKCSQKLKELLETNGRHMAAQDDPYIFSEFESIDVTVTMQCESSRDQPYHSKTNGFNNISNGVSPKINSGRTVVSTKNCDIFPSHKNESPSSLLSSSKSVGRSDFQTLVAKHATDGKVNSSDKEQRSIFGRSQMSRLALAKIEKTIDNQSKSLDKNNSQRETVNTCQVLPMPYMTGNMAALAGGLTAKQNTCKTLSLIEENLTKTEVYQPKNEPSAVNPNLQLSLSSRTHPSLNVMWNLRNEIKLLKRNYDEHLGKLLACTINLINDPIHRAILEKTGPFFGDSKHIENEDEMHLIQKHWFSLCHNYNSFTGSNRKRETKLTQLKTELRHKLMQYQWRHRDDYYKEMGQLLIKCARARPNLAGFLIQMEGSSINKKSSSRSESRLAAKCRYSEMVEGGVCTHQVLPAAPFCPLHITYHSAQMLFSTCGASTSDGIACEAPALRNHNVPLCPRHEKDLVLPENVLFGSTANKPVPTRRHRSSNASNRPKKRKRQQVKTKEHVTRDIGYVAPPTETVRSDSVKVNNDGEGQDVLVEIGDELAISSSGPLDSTVLATLDTHSLEETDLSHVLNHISPEAFNDLFTDKYETDTAELERALEAVNNDTLTFLNMLDPETLASLPEIMRLPNATIEQAICDGQLFIPPHADILQS